MINFGFIFGFLLGIPVAFIDHTLHQWWLLPILGVIVGWTTNLLGMQLIFEPPEPKTILGIKFHGLFLRRQDEAAEVYAQIIADDVVTLENIGNFLIDGPARRPHPADDPDRARPGDRRRDGSGSRGRPGRDGPGGVRLRARVRRPRGRRPHAHPVQGPGVLRASSPSASAR